MKKILFGMLCNNTHEKKVSFDHILLSTHTSVYIMYVFHGIILSLIIVICIVLDCQCNWQSCCYIDKENREREFLHDNPRHCSTSSKVRGHGYMVIQSYRYMYNVPWYIYSVHFANKLAYSFWFHISCIVGAWLTRILLSCC